MKNIANALFLFSAAETDTATAAGAPEVKKSKVQVQHTITTEERDKTFITDLQEEFGLKNTKETVAALIAAATLDRFYKVQSEDENGEPVFDDDSNPVMETRDKLEDAANGIIAARDGAKAERLKAKLLEQLAALGVEIPE